MLHRFVVDERRWLDERAFLDALNFCTLLPGPEAQQLATYLGWRLHGVRGGLVAGGLFVVPGALVMLALSLLYALGQRLAVVDGAVPRDQGGGARDRRRGAAAHRPAGAEDAACSSPSRSRLPGDRSCSTRRFPLVILGAALRSERSASAVAPGALRRSAAGPAGRHGRPAPARGALAAALVCAVAWWLPGRARGPARSGRRTSSSTSGCSSRKLAVVTFGGAYAVLAYLADAAVETQGWVSAGEMVDGLGLAETTPGPTILVNQFVGYLAALRRRRPSRRSSPGSSAR